MTIRQFILPLAHEHTERFQSLVQRADGDACWTWTGNRSKRRDGSLSYGRFCIGKDCQLAHRVAWMISNGPIPDDQVVRHRCDNVACVRPDHLALGTQADNLQDMRERGRAHFNRFPSGAMHPNARLSDSEVADLRALRAAGATFSALGKLFGVHPSTAHAIAVGETRRAA
jgi:hypothetical protein